MGAEARQFIDFLSEASVRYWQVCPLGPTGYGDSPYQCVSAFAGNPYLIDLMDLCKGGILRSESLGPLLFLPADKVDYGALYKLKWPVLRRSFDGFRAKSNGNGIYGDFQQFKDKHSEWLEPFAWYQALKQKFGGKPWYGWPEGFRSYDEFLKNGGSSDQECQEEAEAQRFYQYLFYGQWKKLRRYARERQVRIIGDIPIFVSYDSADVWAAPHLFQINPKNMEPVAVAGVPPDYFSADGQYWGNPLFDWDRMAKDGYQWWMKRLKANFELYDVVRIDHFRGFEAYWSIPYGAPTAKSGKWIKGPGLKFFKAIADQFPNARIIAEDLGSLSPEVYELLDQTGLPGMAVLQFAFGGDAENLYLPHNHKVNSLVYPGTHDNDTTLGWYKTADEKTQDHVRRYFRISGQEVPWDFIRSAYRSVSRLAVLPLQDLMSLDSSARFNMPGQQHGNWQWRYHHEQLQKLRKESSAYLAELAALYGRNPDLDSPKHPTTS